MDYVCDVVYGFWLGGGFSVMTVMWRGVAFISLLGWDALGWSLGSAFSLEIKIIDVFDRREWIFDDCILDLVADVYISRC